MTRPCPPSGSIVVDGKGTTAYFCDSDTEKRLREPVTTDASRYGQRSTPPPRCPEWTSDQLNRPLSVGKTAQGRRLPTAALYTPTPRHGSRRMDRAPWQMRNFGRFLGALAGMAGANHDVPVVTGEGLTPPTDPGSSRFHWALSRAAGRMPVRAVSVGCAATMTKVAGGGERPGPDSTTRCTTSLSRVWSWVNPRATRQGRGPHAAKSATHPVDQASSPPLPARSRKDAHLPRLAGVPSARTVVSERWALIGHVLV